MAAGIAVIGVLVACSDGSSSSTTSTTTEADERRPLSVLVTNDDGFAAPGIDAMVETLGTLPGVTVTVVAPATDRSGTGSQTMPGEVTATRGRTAAGFPAIAVDGFPADAVRHALDTVLPKHPDLVVSGINRGPNLGPLAAVSGTVGAAKQAARAGIPALAVSQGLGSPPDYPAAAKIVAGWVAAHRAQLARRDVPDDVLNLNVPTCTAATVRGVEQVPLAPELTGRDLNAVNCASTATDLADDVAAFLDGFASVTSLQPDGEPVTTTTTWTSR